MYLRARAERPASTRSVRDLVRENCPKSTDPWKTPSTNPTLMKTNSSSKFKQAAQTSSRAVQPFLGTTGSPARFLSAHRTSLAPEKKSRNTQSPGHFDQSRFRKETVSTMLQHERKKYETLTEAVKSLQGSPQENQSKMVLRKMISGNKGLEEEIKGLENHIGYLQRTKSSIKRKISETSSQAAVFLGRRAFKRETAGSHIPQRNHSDGHIFTGRKDQDTPALRHQLLCQMKANKKLQEQVDDIQRRNKNYLVSLKNAKEQRDRLEQRAKQLSMKESELIDEIQDDHVSHENMFNILCRLYKDCP